jgi:hypothetical protein
VTGRLVRILDEHSISTASGPVPLLMWTNASGSVLAGGFRSGPGSTTIGLISGSHRIRVPWPARLWMAAAAW